MMLTMDNRHILIVEQEHLFAEMFRYWLHCAPEAGRTSYIASWQESSSLDKTVKGVLVRAGQFPVEAKTTRHFFKRHPVDSLVLLGEGKPVEIPGCVVTRLTGVFDREDVYHGLGLQHRKIRHPSFENAGLTAKERDVVCMTVKGYVMKEVAEELSCTVSTVQSYKTRAMEKLGVSHLADLSVAAAAQGLRDCPCRGITPERLIHAP